MNFMKAVKDEYERRTGEMMIPFEEWEDNVKNSFELFKKTNDPVGFVDLVLGE